MPDSLRGTFLIAGRNLRDPNFFKSVVLIVEHGDTGAMGVVINHPSGVTIAEALKSNFELPETGEIAYFGGPVERNAMFILHNAADLDSSETPVLDGVFVGGSPEAFKSVVERVLEGESELKFRVYFGCAGWAPEQLEGELARSDWLVCPAVADYVFHPNPYEVWNLAVADYNKANPLLPGLTGDPGMN
ncbi:MAG TPA: YqgE/AlgH family protein [Planctomycetaceae bacterium]|nr:YqgE/AlgH family protein [Planctomycetaceae bacterium]